VSTASRKRPQFPPHSAFRAELNRRVDAYFEQSGLNRTGGPYMLVKSAMILGWVVASYALLVFWADSWWTALPLAVSLALGMACIGFAIQHDGNHGAYSHRPLVNRLATATLDLLGASSYIWRQKHNVLHHTYTNIDGVDDDINAQPFLRLAPSQPYHRLHRFQHLYFPLLIGLFFTSKWVIWDDFAAAARGTIGSQRIPRPRGWELAQMIGGKLFFLSWALALPMTLHPVATVLGFYVLTSFVMGLTLGLVFQLAHAVEEAGFTVEPDGGKNLELPWYEHQLTTTANFAGDNRLITWYVGGLNHQVEHHLFPRINHKHYQALAPIVREVCQEYGVPYLEHPTMRRAIVSHLRFLMRMGKAPAPAAQAEAVASSAQDIRLAA
jgi:linoleoyl-CoA desaturase